MFFGRIANRPEIIEKKIVFFRPQFVNSNICFTLAVFQRRDTKKTTKMTTTIKTFEIVITDSKLYDRKVSDIDFDGTRIFVYGWGMLKNNADKMLAIDGHTYKQYGFKLIQK